VTTPGCPLDRLTFLSGIGGTPKAADLASKANVAIFGDNDPAQIIVIGHTMMGNLIILILREEDRGVILFKTFDAYFDLADGIEDLFKLLKEPSEE
jgi:hypothetical protein